MFSACNVGIITDEDFLKYSKHTVQRKMVWQIILNNRLYVGVCFENNLIEKRKTHWTCLID